MTEWPPPGYSLIDLSLGHLKGKVIYVAPDEDEVRQYEKWAKEARDNPRVQAEHGRIASIVNAVAASAEDEVEARYLVNGILFTELAKLRVRVQDLEDVENDRRLADAEGGR